MALDLIGWLRKIPELRGWTPEACYEIRGRQVHRTVSRHLRIVQDAAGRVVAWSHGGVNWRGEQPR